MKKIELLDKMELIDAEYVVEAEAAGGARSGKRRPRSVARWAAVAACLCLLVTGAALLLPRLTQQPSDPSIAPFEGTRSTAKVTFGYDGRFTGVGQMSYVAFTEEEALTDEHHAVIRGTVSSLTNVMVDYNGDVEYYCIAEVVISRVYRGELTEGETVKMLLPCPIETADGTQPDVRDEDGITKYYGLKGVGEISHLRCGTEGIFIPRLLDEDSYIERNGATLVVSELAQCRLNLGGWAFIDTDEGLKFNQYRYIGAQHAMSLDDVEEYIIEMLK